MSELTNVFSQLSFDKLGQMYQAVKPVFSKIILSIVVLLVGWICAVLVKKIIGKLLKALGFDVVSEKVGIRRFLQKGGITRSPSYLVGLGFYWLIIFSAIIMAFNAVHFGLTSQLVKQITASYAPRIIGALIVLILGVLIAQFAGRFTRTTFRLADVPFASALGTVTHYTIIGLTVIIALERLGVDKSLIIPFLFILFFIVPLMICFVLIVGGREIISSLLAGRFLKKIYAKGEKIQFDSVVGEIDSIDFMTTTIKDIDEEIVIPNSELAKKIIKKVKK